MSRKFKIRDQEAVHFVTFTVIHWLDPLKRDKRFHPAAIQRYFLRQFTPLPKHKGLELYAYCIMSSHVHDCCQTRRTKFRSCHQGYQKYTSVKLIQAIRDNDQESRKELFLWLFERAGKCNPHNTQYQFWQCGQLRKSV